MCFAINRLSAVLKRHLLSLLFWWIAGISRITQQRDVFFLLRAGRSGKIWHKNVDLSLETLIATIKSMRKKPLPIQRDYLLLILGFTIYLDVGYLRKEVSFGKGWKHL